MFPTHLVIWPSASWGNTDADLRISLEPHQDCRGPMLINDPPPPRRAMPPEEPDTVLSGVVHRYFADIKLGTIKSNSGRLYSFHEKDWICQENSPALGVRVIFELQEIRAVKIQAED